MKIRYNHYSGKSSIVWFEIGTDFIRVKYFDKEQNYTYNYEGKSGSKHATELKRWIQLGNGLQSYNMIKLRFKHD